MTRRQTTIKRLGDLFDCVDSTTIAWLERRAARCDLTIHSMGVLKFLAGKGEETLTRIGHQIGVPPSSMTGIAARLTETGYVERGPSSVDRRSVVLRITDLGEQTLTQLKETLERDLEDILGDLSQERLEALVDDIERITNRVGQLADRLERESRQARIEDAVAIASD